jgi:RNA:NAD 2'-phosphotransferase (TPT1/KptA family)
MMLYHGTSEGAFRKIRECGLAPRSNTGNGQYIYFSSTETYALSYASRKSQGTIRVLRVQANSNITPDPDTGFKGDYKTTKSIPPDNIAVKHNGRWIPIQEYSDEEHNIMPISRVHYRVGKKKENKRSTNDPEVGVSR